MKRLSEKEMSEKAAEKALTRLHDASHAFRTVTEGGKRPFRLTICGSHRGNSITEDQWKRMEKVSRYVLKFN